METRFTYAIALIAFLSVAACIRQEQDTSGPMDFEGGDQPVLIASREDDSLDSRTVIVGDGTSVFWSPDETIQMFDRDRSIVFQSRNTVPASRTTFYYSSMFEMETGGRNMSTLAFYPFNNENEYHFTHYTEPTPDLRYKPFSIIHKLPSVQKGEAGTFAKGLFPAIAIPDYDSGSARWTAVFSNVCGGARFSVAQEGITSITIKSLGGEPVTGTIDVGYIYSVKIVDGVSYNSIDTLDVSVVQGFDSVTIIAPDNGFVPGKEYFAIMAPQVLKQGLVIQFIKNRQAASFTINKPITIRRSHFGKLDNLDKGLVFTDLPADPSQAIIPFSDEHIKRDLVSAFDNNGDGELSYAEAAAVTSLNGVFRNKNEYRSFDELQYFSNLSNLTESLFDGWTRLVSIVLPESIQSISSKCFHGCSSLQSLIIPGSVTRIFPTAITGCTALTKLMIEEDGSPLTILAGAISQCPGLASITLPDRVILNENSFSDCNTLRVLTIGKSLSTAGISSAFKNCPIETVVVRDGTEIIPQFAFSGCSSLLRVQLPESLTSIEYGAFSNANIQETLLFPNALKYIYNRAFHHFNGSVSSFPEGLLMIGDEAFLDCSGLTEITIPEGVNIGRGAFKQCTALKTATLLPNSGYLSDQLFADCSALTSVNLPNGLTTISQLCFSNCKALTSIIIPSSVKTIEESAFSNSALTEIQLPPSLLTIRANAFLHCENLSALIFPDSLLELEDYAFCESGLTTVTLPCHLSSIGASAFRDCKQLESVFIPESVQTIKSSAFYNCTGLKSIIISRSTPPDLQELSWGRAEDDSHQVFGRSFCPIYVPDLSVEAYKTADKWTAYADRIKPKSELPNRD